MNYHTASSGELKTLQKIKKALHFQLGSHLNMPMAQANSFAQKNY